MLRFVALDAALSTRRLGTKADGDASSQQKFAEMACSSPGRQRRQCGRLARVGARRGSDLERGRTSRLSGEIMLKTARVELAEANAFVSELHRHHKKVTGHRFSVGCTQNGWLVGVAICGRPVARKTDQKYVLEVLRLCTDGEKNACSFLYAACARIAKEMGFTKIQTFILESESGATLRAAGWERGHLSSGGTGWQSRANRRSDQPTTPKVLFFKTL